MFKVNSRHQNDIFGCLISSCQGRRCGVFIDNKLSHLVPVFLLLTLNKQIPARENIYGTKS